MKPHHILYATGLKGAVSGEGSLADALQGIATTRGQTSFCAYQTVGPTLDTVVNDLRLCLKMNDQETTLVATSLGAWASALLLPELDEYPHLQHVVLIHPYLSGTAHAFPTLAKMVGRTIGLPVNGHWITSEMVRNLLTPQNDVNALIQRNSGQCAKRLTVVGHTQSPNAAQEEAFAKAFGGEFLQRGEMTPTEIKDLLFAA